MGCTAAPRPAPRGCCAAERESPQRGGDSRAGSRSSMAVQRFPQSPPRVSRRACGARAGRGTPRTRTRGRTARSHGARTAGSPFAPSPSQGDDPRSPPRTAPLSSGAVTPRAGSRFDAVSTFGRKAAGPWHAVFLTLAPAGFTTLAPCRLHSALGLAPTLLSQQAAWLPAPVDPSLLPTSLSQPRPRAHHCRFSLAISWSYIFSAKSFDPKKIK